MKSKFDVLLEKFLLELGQKGCHVSCCGVDAFYNSKTVIEIFGLLVAEHMQELNDFLTAMPHGTAAEISETLSCYGDVSFLLRMSSQDHMLSAQDLHKSINERADFYSRELALLRRNRKS